jgi:hypothetical protein
MKKTNHTECLSVSELHALLPRIVATVEAAERFAHYREAIASVLGTNLDGELTHKNGQSSSPPRGRKRNSPAESAQDRDRIVDQLKSHGDGLSASEIAKTLNVRPKVVSYSLLKLRKEQKVEMSGHRQFAKWYATA